ncbi:MAG: adenosylcobalamin-dependent ribonucleoside-diphosphate reductase [Deltaproteobacteria bacterium]|nr:MAG: adenosylcobalamin-dependent ribonucleoside-diphosphate reductase [Deltaproteobacteria bacterium]
MKLSPNAELVFYDRYALHEKETWEEAALRVAQAVAKAEADKEKIERWTEKFAEIIAEQYFLPGGRILRNAGRSKRLNLFNCFTLPPVEDNIESIGETMKNALICWSYGGGIGIDWSNLRPKGAPLLSKGGKSSGLVSFIRSLDYIGQTIETGGSRRSGALAIVSAQHPEVLDFIEAKVKHGELSAHNISVGVTYEFLEAVDQDEEWILEFGGKEYLRLPARELWNKILDNMLQSAEPGLINYTNIRKNNSYYFAPIAGCNLCGELPLSAFEGCCLGALVLPRFVQGTQTNWKKMEEVIWTAVRFLDNVIDVNYYFLPQIEEVSKQGRRIGLGVMGLADYLFAKQIRYGSERSVEEVSRLFRFIRDTAYQASIALAQEKVPFPKFDRFEYLKASFIRKLPPSLRMDIKKYSIRNVTLMACAPTGTISLLADVTSGVEPLFAKAYRREDRIGARVYIHPLYKKFLQEGEIPDWFVDTYDISPREHLEVQVTIQKYVDGSISKTLNLPATTTVEELSELFLEYFFDLKGITVYRDRCRPEQVLYHVSEKEAREFLEQADERADEETIQCRSGVCEL